MIKHLLISSFRNLVRNRLFSIVSLLGLSISMLAAISILKHVAYEQSFDQYHQDTDDLYRLSISYTDPGGNFEHYAGVAAKLLPQLQEEFPEIQSGTRVIPLLETQRHSILSANVNGTVTSFDESNVFAVDASFQELMRLEIVNGAISNFTDKGRSVVLSEQMASKLFSDVDPIGQLIDLNGDVQLEVVATFKNWPENVHFRPEVLLPLSYTPLNFGVEFRQLHFLGSEFYTYIRLNENAAIKEFEEGLGHFVQRHLRAYDNQDVQLHLTPFQAIHLNAMDQSNDMAEKKDGKVMGLLILLAGLILLTAWLNYLNLVSSRVFQRSKEIAIKRIHGAGNLELFWQLILDSSLLLAVSIGVMVTFSQFLSDQIAGIVGPGDLPHLLGSPWLCLGFVGLMLFGLCLSALYPTLLVKKFKNTQLIKGQFKNSNSSIFLKKLFVITQYTFTIGLVFGSLTVINQIQHLRSAEMNIDLDHVLALKGPGTKDARSSYHKGQADVVKTSLKNISGVSAVSTSNYIPGTKVTSRALLSNPLIHGEEENYINRIFADQDFSQVFDLQLKSGRTFTRADMDQSREVTPVIVNELAVKNLGFDDAEAIIGKKLIYWNDTARVIGVVEDFHMSSPDQPMEPLFFYPTVDSKYISLRVSGVEPDKLLSSIEEQWKALFPNDPFEYLFVRQHYDAQYAGFDRLGKQLTLMTFLCLLVASLGLLALAFDAALQRTKEVGIRKVLGANVMAILRLFLRDYIGLIAVAALVAVPVVYWILDNWLQSHVHRIAVGAGLILLPIVITVVIASIVITTQTYRTARMNPVESLRYE